MITQRSEERKLFYVVRHGRSVVQRADAEIVFAIDLPEKFTVDLGDGCEYNAQAVTMSRWLAADKIMLFCGQFYRVTAPYYHKKIKNLIDEFHAAGGVVYNENDPAISVICRRILKAVRRDS